MSDEPKKNPLREVIQPFIDLVHAPRALWGINLAYLIEGTVYFGMLNYLHMYFNQYVQLNDVYANLMVGVQTAGITFAMFLLGFVADKGGVRFALLFAFILMLAGRSLLALGPTVGLPADGLGSMLHFVAMGGILLLVTGYGMYQPGAYAAVRQFTSEKTASMGFAMLYAIMNLGIVLTAGFGWVRNTIEIKGAYWVFVALTLASLLITYFILSPKTVKDAIARAKAEREAEKQAKKEAGNPTTKEDANESEAAGNSNGTSPHGPLPFYAWLIALGIAACSYLIPTPWSYLGYALAGVLLAAFFFYHVSLSAGVALHLWVSVFLGVACVYLIPEPWNYWVWGVLGLFFFVLFVCHIVFRSRWTMAVLRWVALHPLGNGKFFFFIFCLIPVQTLFAHNWLTLPMYIERAYLEGWPWISKYFEFALALNPLLVFIFVPIVTALSYKRKVYNMMILGTFIMAAPTFLLALGPSPLTLFAYILIMTLGESMWQPRFLQYAAEIAPEGRTGIYMGVAQFPWFLTKMIVPLYGGWFLQKYCPQDGVINTEPMWFYYALIAISSTVMLLIAKPWVGKDFKTKAD
jgi:MFS family permease